MTTSTFIEAVRAALGNAPENVEPGKLNRIPTNGRRGDTSGWAKLFPDGRAGVYGCFRSGASHTWSADTAPMTPAQRAELARHVAQAAAEREAAQREVWGANAARIERLWAQCVPLVPGDPVTLYLKHRGLGGLRPLPPSVRYHRALPYFDGEARIGTYPAMVAEVVAPDGRRVALHRTWITKDGRKAEVPTPRKLTPAAGPLAGSAIPLGRPDTRGRIAAGEGVETALSCFVASGLPTVATVSANGMAAYRWPKGAREVIVFADHDAAGLTAARQLRDRALAAGLRSRVLAPTEAGMDWNEVLKAAAGQEGAPA